MIRHSAARRLGANTAPWIVTKFGGTSVARVERWRRIEDIVRARLAKNQRVMIVCSALSGVTNQLEALVKLLAEGRDPSDALAQIVQQHLALGASMRLDAQPLLAADFERLTRLAHALRGNVSAQGHAQLLAQGELMSTRLGSAFLARQGLKTAWLDARTLLTTSPHANDGDERYLSARCAAEPSPEARAMIDATCADVVVTQGFIARDPSGETVVLGRGGSDASAAYLAATIEAHAVEIWSDVPGMFSADPRIDSDARLLRRLSYAEAEALGALGAKVLHPRTIEPLRAQGIPLSLGWTAHPEHEGTRVSGARPPRGTRAVVARRDLALLSMARPSSWQPVGFMAEVAARFQRRGLSMDLISSSASEIRATVDLCAFPSARGALDQLREDLAEVCRPRVSLGFGSVSLVGTGIDPFGVHCPLLHGELSKVHVHLFGHGANNSHVTYVVDEADVPELTAAAHRSLLRWELCDDVFGRSWSDLHAPEPGAEPDQAAPQGSEAGKSKDGEVAA